MLLPGTFTNFQNNAQFLPYKTVTKETPSLRANVSTHPSHLQWFADTEPINKVVTRLNRIQSQADLVAVPSGNRLPSQRSY